MTLTDTSQSVLGGQVLKLGLHSRRRDIALLGDEVCDNTSNVRGGHGSAGDGASRGVAADPSRDGVNTGSPDVDDGTVVGEGGLGIGDGRGSDGDGGGSTSRGGVGSVDVGVTGGDDNVDASAGQLEGRGSVNELRESEGGIDIQRRRRCR